MKSRWIMSVVGLAAAWGLISPTSVSASVVYGFVNITNNSAVDADTGEAQLSVTVADAGSNQVSFTFNNAGPLASSITDVYFDDGTLLDIATVTNGAGVIFSEGASPPDLPGGNNLTVPFQTTAGFLADSNPPAQPNGVNPGEFVTITFNLLPLKTYADTIAALDAGDDLRVGIHVQGFAGGGSESFVNDNPTGGPSIVPLPPVLLGGALLMGLVARGRSRTSV